MGGFAAVERYALADTLIRVGPDAPTLCTGWSAADLAAHLVIREARPLAAMGIVVKPLAPLTKRVQEATRARTPYATLVERVRQGPPLWSVFRPGPIDTAANTFEYFVHHEDLRRAVGDGPRELEPDQSDDLWERLRRQARLMFRPARVGVTLVRAENSGSPRQTVVAKAATPLMVTVTGPVGELVLFAFGRKGAARVQLTGDDAAVDRLRGTKLGI
ncbi:TIGR03085 family metal-binding protein [Actinocrinis sp.]|uniref:TIGR03085 family metal-binding protein n=1 Tax=Actinocrinis sp. TaxID=1920516 RepID=UPI002DDDABCD|nr:TIGR03085 family metal-binding protein [Actinocrinis sp.]